MSTITLEIEYNQNTIGLSYDPTEHYIEDVTLQAYPVSAPLNIDTLFVKVKNEFVTLRKVLTDMAHEQFCMPENRDQWDEEQRMAEAEYRMER